jgi:GNAT superfamily N-acetyltransferase
MGTAHEIADAYWAGVFEVKDSAVWPDGVRATFVENGWNGVYVMRVGRSVRVRAPRHSRKVVEALMSGASVDSLTSRSLWLAGLADIRPTVLGPAAHFLASSMLDGGDGVTGLDPGHISSFVAGLDPDELDESGISDGAGAALFGAWMDGRLAAVASLSEWAGDASDVGVITHPLFRGRGLGQRVAAAAINDAVSRCGYARWRSREDNAGSMRLAQRLGLAYYGTNLGVRLG